ncbi:hypothetical protein [uncultured Methanospirillum sp.]|uniref:hypothetical protein n=1 Tax=uncultured Methanospirillum sp. TaxID=262503 RepID=UPI0029C90A35|nr:hypothetical protein [uncultured Methanospirillum sp.]
MLSLALEHVILTPDIISFAQTLWQNGVGTYDALHYASALSAGEAFLMVDDTLIKKMEYETGQSHSPGQSR